MFMKLDSLNKVDSQQENLPDTTKNIAPSSSVAFEAIIPNNAQMKREPLLFRSFMCSFPPYTYRVDQQDLKHELKVPTSSDI